MLDSLIFTVLTAACASAHSMPELEACQGGPMATVYSSCKNKGDVVLTFFHLCANIVLIFHFFSYDISKTLVAAGAVGTFFFSKVCVHYDAEEQKRVNYVYAHGHMIGSHTWARLDLTTLTWDKLHDEMWRVELALRRIIGVTPVFMRPPFRNYNNLVHRAAYHRNQSLAIWDFDSGDSTGKTVAQSEALYNGVVSSHPASLLSLNHETYGASHQVLPYTIAKLQGAGYKLVTLATCLGMPAYQSVGALGTPDATWRF
ncbi:carbohydrate esterase family 4 protein [Mycena vulgaris]|nr:carbohydrate esterase family 4 protein [Mycena vulgaris]